jgi:hypothetical protein
VTYLLQQINEGGCNSFRKKLNGIWLVRQASKDAGEHQEVDIIIVDSTNLFVFISALLLFLTFGVSECLLPWSVDPVERTKEIER